MHAQSRWFLPLMAASGVTMSLTAPLEVLFVREFWHSSIYVGVFMLSAAAGMVAVDVFGTRFVPRLDARVALVAGLCLFGMACVNWASTRGCVGWARSAAALSRRPRDHRLQARSA
jgi:hypothetical protein